MQIRVRNSILSVSALVLLLGLIPACKKQAIDTIRIGEVGSMTGPDATFGISTHQGILLAINEVNASGGVHGKKLELLTQDDQGKASEAVLGITKLINQHKVQAVLGEVASSLSLAMAPIAQQSKIPMISPSSIHARLTEQGDYIFRVCFIDQFQSKVMADFALKHLKAKTAALLRDVKSDYSRDSARIFADLFTRGGGKIVMDQSYSSGDVDFKSQLTAIRASHPDVILVPGYYTDVGLIARQREELGIAAPLLGGDGWDSPKLREIGGSALQGSFFVSHFSGDSRFPKGHSFYSQYKAAYGEAPDGLAALGYDAAMVLVDSLKRSSLGPSDALRSAIASTRDFQGVTGKISIDSHRNAIKEAVVFKLGAQGDAQVLTSP